jgi:hypothetical protein
VSFYLSHCHVLLQVITDVVAAVIATVFAIILLAQTAQKITGIITSNNGLSQGSAIAKLVVLEMPTNPCRK